MEVNVEPSLSIQTSSEVVCVEFSPFEWSRNLLAVALPSALNIYSIILEEDIEGDGGAEFQLECECQVEGECTALAWSSQSSLRSTPPLLQLLLATSDDAVLQFTTNLKTTTLTELFRHSSAINSVACSSSGVCASVGDDQLLRVWQEKHSDDSQGEGEKEQPPQQQWMETMMLMEPGQSVKFHPENPNMLLVCEVSGTLRMYRINQSQDDTSHPTLTAEWSARCPSPTLDADWSLCDVNQLVAAGPSGVTVLNMDSNGSVRRSVRSAGGGVGVGAVVVRCCRNSRQLVATVTPDNTVTVIHTAASRIPLAAHLKAVSGMSWHLEQPYLAVGSDRQLLIWRVQHV